MEKENTITCENCGQVITLGERFVTDDYVTLCEDCYDECARCYDCGDVIYREDALHYVESEDEYFCESCLRSHFSHCCGCGALYRTRYLNDDGYCDDCADEMSVSVWQDKPYEFSPIASPLNKVSKSTGRGRYFGLELECDGITDGESFQSALAGLRVGTQRVFYFCSDCSLSDRGIEVVTQPATRDLWERTSLLDDFESVLREHGGASYDNNAGLHIHVNRDSLGADGVTQQFNIGKIALVMAGLENALAGISRREDCDASTGFRNRWGKSSAPLAVSLDGRRDEVTARFMRAVQAWYPEQMNDRYRALNVQPAHTIEFRFWGNAVSRDDVLVSVQAVDCLIEYAITHTVKQCLETRTIARWFRDERIPDELYRAFQMAGLV